jgi:hypothetical protein
LPPEVDDPPLAELVEVDVVELLLFTDDELLKLVDVEVEEFEVLELVLELEEMQHLVLDASH